MVSPNSYAPISGAEPTKEGVAADDRCLHLLVDYFLLVENHIAWDPLNGWIGSQLGIDLSNPIAYHFPWDGGLSGSTPTNDICGIYSVFEFANYIHHDFDLKRLRYRSDRYPVRCCCKCSGHLLWAQLDAHSKLHFFE